jgi:hypothetical protein
MKKRLRKLFTVRYKVVKEVQYESLMVYKYSLFWWWRFVHSAIDLHLAKERIKRDKVGDADIIVYEE